MPATATTTIASATVAQCAVITPFLAIKADVAAPWPVWVSPPPPESSNGEHPGNYVEEPHEVIDPQRDRCWAGVHDPTFERSLRVSPLEGRHGSQAQTATMRIGASVAIAFARS